MGNFNFADLLHFLKDTWLMYVIGVATACAAFAAGLTTLRRRKPRLPKTVDTTDSAPANGGTNERRAALRRGGHPVTVDLHDPDEIQPSQQGWVVDRSVTGLCLMVPNALPIGSFWKVRPCNAPQTTPAVRLEVINCEPDRAEWKLGCRFEKTPNYAILLMFG